MISVYDESLKTNIVNDYNNQVDTSDTIKTEFGNLFRYNYMCRRLSCITSNEVILAQKMLDINQWLHNPRKEILSWESELQSWN